MPGLRSAGLVLACLVGGLMTPAGTAHATAAPRGELTAYMRPVKVMTSTGRHLRLWLQAEPYSLDVTLGRGRLPRAAESHDWILTPPRRMFRYDRNRGRGRIDVGRRATGGFAQVHLEFRRTGAWKDETCENGAASDAAIDFEGTVAFRSHTGGRRPWGRVATFAQPLHISVGGTLRGFDNCQPPTDNSCHRGYVWQHAKFVTQPLQLGSRSVSVLEASRWHQQVGDHVHVQRLDDVLLRASPPRLHERSDGSAVLHITTDSERAHGSARLVARQPAVTTRNSCGTTREWHAQLWRNGTRPLTILMDVGADMSARDGKGGFFRRTLTS